MPLKAGVDFGMSEAEARKLFVKINLAKSEEDLISQLGLTGDEKRATDFISYFLKYYFPDEVDEENIRIARERPTDA